MCKFLRACKPDEIIVGGDLLDMQALSPHLVKARNLRQIASSSVKKEIEAGARLLDDYQKHTKRLVYLQGNHEFWVNRWINENPQFAGLIEIPEQLQLKKRGIRWIPSWENKELLYMRGRAGFIHGIYAGLNHASQMATKVDCNVFYGHTHDTNCYTRSFLGQRQQRVAQALGCLCVYQQPYMLGNPNNWQQALAVFHFRDDGYFNYEVLRIFNGVFFYGKDKFDGRA